MKQELYVTDILIFGTGVAGLAMAASLLQQGGLRVTLINSGSLPDDAVMAPVAPGLMKVLTSLGLDEKEAGYHGADGQHHIAWNQTCTQEQPGHNGRSGLHFIDRKKCRLSLMEKVLELGGRVFPRTACLSLAKDGERWIAGVVHEGGKKRCISAGYVVDATGRQRVISDMLDIAVTEYDRLCAATVFSAGTRDEPPSSGTMIESVAEGWWYQASFAGYNTATTFLTDKDIAGRLQLHTFQGWLDQLGRTRCLTHNIAYTGRVRLQSLSASLSDFAKVDRFIAIGEAAASLDPISVRRFGFALSSGVLAATALVGSLNGSAQAMLQYQQQLTRDFHRERTRQQLHYGREQRWPEALFWSRRQAFIPVRSRQSI